MALIEREGYLEILQRHFETVAAGEGHCIMLCGEAGIGKTALVRVFCKQQSNECSIYQGACDDLFTPRSLAPLYDVLWQLTRKRRALPAVEQPSILFSTLFQELSNKEDRFLLVFEDIHWADEGTLDFIKFFVRRIDQLPCLFILTYRDIEVDPAHPFRNVLGQLPPDSFTKLVLKPLSKKAVIEMAQLKGYSGEEVYNIAGGNPFYVNEILANYSPGIPDSIKNSILSIYERQKEAIKNAWQIWSIMPDGLELEFVSKFKEFWGDELEHCFALNVITVDSGRVVFKHDLFRRAIEETLGPTKRIKLNKKMLELFLDCFEERGETERILHYAKNANEKELVVRFAPLAAKKAISIGAHKEASKLLLTAIEYLDLKETDLLEDLYETCAYESYISGQVTEAIVFLEKVLAISQGNNNPEKTIQRLCNLSNLWWFNGNGKNSESLIQESLDLVTSLPFSSLTAITFNQMCEWSLRSDAPGEGIKWGEQALEIARQSGPKKLLAQIYSNIGIYEMLFPATRQKGLNRMQQSLEMAMLHADHEGVVRIYSNLGFSSIRVKDYGLARTVIEEGIRYSEEKNLHIWTDYLLSLKSRVELDLGHWKEALHLADFLLKKEDQPSLIKINSLIVRVRILMRQGKEIETILLQAKSMSLETRELNLILSMMVTCLEYEWLTGKKILTSEDIELVSYLMDKTDFNEEKAELIFWLKKTGRHFGHNTEAAYDTASIQGILNAASIWEIRGCPYEKAMVLFNGKDYEKRKAIILIQELGAIAVYEKLKQEMRDLGIKNIPHGIRNSTRSNVAHLTNRELEVLAFLKEGKQNKEIAGQLYISLKTVDHHISNILLKLGTNSRTKAVTEAISLGILK